MILIQRKMNFFLTICICLLISNSGYAESEVESLSPELRALLSKEMLLIQEGMMAIIPEYSAGNNQEIASIAMQIKESFVLEQKLSQTQKMELQNKLPAAFFELDEQFHYNAGMLQHAAQNNKEELIGFYFSQLSEACAGCHGQYALHKFPNLAKKVVDEKHVH